jgi:NADH-quinone oxidoreductase subunit E
VNYPVIEKTVNHVLSKYTGKPGALLRILEELQTLHPNKYLPAETMEYVAKKLNLPLSSIYSVVTFYAFFNLQPQGKHTIVVCRGTACHTRGSKQLLETLKLMFDLDDGLAESGKVFLTTQDRKFTIKTVACFGQCAMAPVLEVDGVVYGNLTIPRMKKLIKEVEQRNSKK